MFGSLGVPELLIILLIVSSCSGRRTPAARQRARSGPPQLQGLGQKRRAARGQKALEMTLISRWAAGEP